MEPVKEKIDPNKKLWITNWAIHNRTTVYLLVILFTLFGIMSYNALPKEQFPEVVFPNILITTVYPGASPQDMENLVVRHIETELNTITGVKHINSKSIQDFAMILIEFDADQDVDLAKQAVKDAVDKARSKLPNDLPNEPEVLKMEINDRPIMFINVAGDFEDSRLKAYAEDLEEAIERVNAINRVDLVGAREREIQVNVDLYRMQAASLSLSDIENAIRMENVTISSGSVDMRELKYAMRVTGEFKSAYELGNIVVRSPMRAQVYLHEVADVVDGYKDRESYARLEGKKAITLNVIKRGGENLIATAEEIRGIVDKMKEEDFPPGLHVEIFGDTSLKTKQGLNELMHTIILGVILVTFVLMFFMGVNNALFVAMCIPITMFLVFMIIPMMDYTLNIMVLFALLMALGILVDNAIVVIENTHRLYGNGANPIVPTANYAAREVFVPVFGGMLVIIAPFAPLLFWPGIIGSFMKYLPSTIMVTLSSSLFVAFFFNPTFAVSFMRPHKELAPGQRRSHKRWLMLVGALAVFGVLMYLAKAPAFGGFLMLIVALMALTRFVFEPAIRGFQRSWLPALDNGYARLVAWAVRRPGKILLGTLGLLIVAIFAVAIAKPPFSFFPKGEPNYTFVYISLPIGTDISYTDSITRIVEKRVLKALEPDKEVVEAVITNVAVAAGDPNPVAFEMGTRFEKAKITISYVDYELRHGKLTSQVMENVRAAVGQIPGAQITVEQEANGPPTGKPVNIEIAGENFDELVLTAKRLNHYLDSAQIAGVEELKMDMDLDKPEVLFVIDRERANRLGISTATVGMALRTAVNGNEVSKFRDNEDQHPIVVRLNKAFRESPDRLLNMNISFMDMSTGGFKSIPASAVAHLEYSTTYGGVKRKDLKRMITLSSNLLQGYNANAVNQQVSQALRGFQHPRSVTVSQGGGEQEQQKETGDFLGVAALGAIMLIITILVTIFDSVGKTAIIGLQVVLSIIGVLLGFAISGKEMSLVMTGVGMIALFGIVVNNGIILIEFMDQLRHRGMGVRKAVTEAGRIRLKPVLLTKSATILGLIPLAIGLNIDFGDLITHGDPHIFFGGDNQRFWAPLCWTIIYGLLFATLLTLVVVPCMYVIYSGWKFRFTRWRNKQRFPRGGKSFTGASNPLEPAWDEATQHLVN